MAAGWDTPGAVPLPPKNTQVVSPFVIGMLDLRWEDPSILTRNTGFTIVGVNIYRSEASDRGPFRRINEFPVGGTFYRDRTNYARIEREAVRWASSWVFKGDAPNDRRWVFRTQNPISKRYESAPHQKPNYADSPTDVQLYINGVEVPVSRVFGQSNEVTLINAGEWDVSVEAAVPASLPTAEDVVEVSYFTPQNHVRSGLEHNIWYRFATVAVDAATPSGYIETPLDWCEPRSVIEVESLDWIWREAMRRNAWILQQGGERVKVFVRKTAGIPCDCRIDDKTLAYSKQPSQRCHLCFAPGTLVRTKAGYRPIESIQVGEGVLSADGTYHDVTRTFASYFTGDLISLMPSVSAKPILATPEHPFLVLRGAHQRQVQRSCGPKCDKYIDRGDGLGGTGSTHLLPSGRWWARVQVNGHRGVGRKALGTFATPEEATQAVQTYLHSQAEPGHVLKWGDANTISKGDWLVTKWASEIADMPRIQIPQAFLKNTPLGEVRLGSDTFDVDSEFLWMIGLYLAEGCKGTRSIQFCLHRDETAYQDRLVQLFTRWGYNPVVHYPKDPDIQSAVVHVASTTLGQWFPAWLGDGCQNKRVPEEFMALPPQKLWAILQGLHDGDGSKRDREITQTSEVLALQIAEMLHRVGEQPLIRRQQSNTLTPNGNKRRLAYCVGWAESTLGHVNRKGRWVYQQEVLAQVRAVEQVPYSGLVYNLEVEGDHTYVVQGVVTHNCFGTGFLGGFEGPYEAIIVPDDAERRIAQAVGGRNKEHTYEVWTGPSPLLTQRDFIVKQTNERYSIGPVRRPSHRGNLMQQHFNIAYFDQGDVRYRVPIDGTTELAWPETRGQNCVRTFTPRPVDQAMTGTAPWPYGPEAQHPMLTEKAEICDPIERRGRTKVWENTEYGILWWALVSSALMVAEGFHAISGLL